MTLVTFGVSMQIEERAKLDAMARADNRTRSNMIVHLTKQEHDLRQHARGQGGQTQGEK